MANSKQIAALFKTYTSDALWEHEDFRIVLLVLEALGLPEDLIKGWKAAARRASAQQLKRERMKARAWVRERRKKSHPYWLPGIWAMSMIGMLECTIAGLTFRHLNDKPALGIGNGLAMSLTVTFLLTVSMLIFGIVKDGYPAQLQIGKAAWLLPRIAFPVWSIGGFIIGSIVLGHFSPIGHLGHDLRDWIGWRF